MTVVHYKRTPEQNFAIGLTSEDTPEDIALKQYSATHDTQDEKKVVSDSVSKNLHSDVDLDKFDYKNEVMTFPSNCYNCNVPTPTKMVVVDIPYFKEVVIMAMSCDQCGYKSNEVKGIT